MNRFGQPIRWFLLALLFIRPTLDVTTDWAIGVASVRMNPAAALGLILIAIGFVWYLNRSRDERLEIVRHPIVWVLSGWLVALFFWAVVPVFTIGTQRIAGVREWVRLVSYLPLFAMVLYYAKRGDGNRFVWAILLSLLIPAVVGFYQIAVAGGDQIKNVKRISSTFVHPNPFSFYLVLLAGLAYWKWRCADRKWLALAFFLVAMALLVSTFSFTGAAMFGVASVVCALGENRRIRYATVAAVLLFVIAFALTPTGWQRIKDEAKVENLDMIEHTGKQTTSLTWRLVNWRFLYRAWKESPWVGRGLGSIPYVNYMLNPEGAGSDAHNDYMRYLTETGAIGLALFLAVLGTVGTALWKRYRIACDPNAKRLAWIAVALYAAWLVGSLNDNLITATAYQYALWSLFAVACGYEKTVEGDN